MAPQTRRPVTRLGLQISSFTFPGIADADLFEHLVSIATAPYLEESLDGVIFNMNDLTPTSAALAGKVLSGILPRA